MKTLKYNEVKLDDMEVVKVLQKGQVVIPKELRDELHLQQGRNILVERVGNGLLLIPAPKDSLRAMRGLLEGIAEEPAVKSIKKMRKESDKRVR